MDDDKRKEDYEKLESLALGFTSLVDVWLDKAGDIEDDRNTSGFHDWEQFGNKLGHIAELAENICSFSIALFWIKELLEEKYKALTEEVH